MGVDPSLAVVSARRTLRRLGKLVNCLCAVRQYAIFFFRVELEAYASVMSAFRAQGPLTG